MRSEEMPQSFWQALVEHIPRLLFGDRLADSWSAEKKQREECERISQNQLEECGRVMREDEYVMTVRDSRGTFTFEEWQKMPPEVPPPLKPWWRD